MTAQEIINQWNSMTGEAQLDFCENCVKRAIKQGRKLKAGYELDDAIQSTAERVIKVLKNPAKLDADTERRESQGKAGNTLAAVVCRAANSTMEYVAYHSGKDSKSVYGATQREVSEKLRKITASIDDRSYQEPCRMRLKEWLDIWTTEYLGDVKPSTAHLYSEQVRLYIIPALGAMRLDELNTHNIQITYNRLKQGKDGKSGLSPKTIRNIHGVLHKALQQAVDCEYLKVNPRKSWTRYGGIYNAGLWTRHRTDEKDQFRPYGTVHEGHFWPIK